MSRRRHAFLAVALVCALLAGGAHAADLLSVIDDAFDHDPALAASRASSRAAMQAVPKARAALLPRVSGGWARAYNGIITEDFPTQHYWQSGWTVALVQPIFDWAKWTAYRQADYVVAREQLKSASVAQETILTAAQAYFDVLAAGDELARADDYLRAVDAQLARLVRAKAAGEATVIDIRDGESSRAQAQLQRLDAQTRMQLARAALDRATGKPVAALAPLPPGGVPTLEPSDVEPWVTQAQTQGYAVQIGELALQIAKLDTEQARAARYPTVDVQLTHTPAGAAGGYSRPTTTTTGMLEVVVPVFTGGEVTAKVAEGEALEDKARDELAAAVRDAGAQARAQWLGVESGRVRVATLEQVVQRSQAALDATRVGFGAGSRTSLDVLRATDTLYASRRDLIRARYDTVLALLNLLAQTSMLDLDEVGRINTQLFAATSSPSRAAARDTGSGRSPPPPVAPVTLPPPAVAVARPAATRDTAAGISPAAAGDSAVRASSAAGMAAAFPSLAGQYSPLAP